MSDAIDRHVDRAHAHLERSGVGDELGAERRARVRDMAIVSGIALAMLGIKALKILPNIPFAPGHKLVLLTPLYLVATLKTRTRAGATLTGVTMGSVAFLLGDGRYGIFEILKHVAPGLVSDLALPLFTRGGKRPSAFACTLLGGLMGMGRFATIFGVTLAVQPPAVAWAMLAPGLAIHTTFGLLSGLVSRPLCARVEIAPRFGAADADASPAVDGAEPPPAAPRE
ncbi:MAG: hypothetical protein JNL38_37520 [Myxococcales bacterium]|jgi:hypothetical protein|nr:hypothetical protein [Myxococcales bacterium]